MKKKVLSVVLSVAMVATLLAGCGGKSLKGKYTAVYDMKDYLNEIDSRFPVRQLLEGGQRLAYRGRVGRIRLPGYDIQAS